MKINQNTVLQGKRVTLVPYTSAHVPRYHEWMQSEELQRLTASEPLSLEQEYEMQRSWREDADSEDLKHFLRVGGSGKQRMSRAVGGLSVQFFKDHSDLLPAALSAELLLHSQHSPEPSYRGRGFGKEATLMMMSYGVRNLGITKFEAKIGQDNEASICMFKKLHFKEIALNSVFQEVTLRLDVSDEERRWLLEETNHMKEKSY
ncbi:N-acetyltransferase 9, partial [Pterocles gutturalis]